jgi:hypothetical protein
MTHTADIGAPFKIVDFFDLAWQRAERLFNLVNLLRFSRLLETTVDHVTQ